MPNSGSLEMWGMFKILKIVFSSDFGVSLLLFLAVVTGLFVTGTQSTAFIYFIFFWVSAFGFALWSGITRGWRVPVRSRVYIAVAMFLGVLLVTLFWSQTLYISTMYSYVLLPLPLMFLAVQASPIERNLSSIFSYVVLAAVGLMSVWLFIQYFYFYDIYGPRPHHPTLNPNNVATFINVGLLWAIGLFIIEEHRFKKVAYTAFIVLLYGALVITQSRMGSACFVISLLVVLISSLFPNPLASLKQYSFKYIGLTAVFVSVPLLLRLYFRTFLVVLPSVSEDELTSFAERVSDTASMDVRFSTWNASWQMVLDNPWFGTGLASFSALFPKYRQLGDINDGFFVHMDPLQFWLEMGVIAPIVFYSILVFVLLRTIRSISQVGIDKSLRVKIIASFAAMLAVAVHAHMSFPLYHAAVVTILALIMVIWYSATRQALPEERLWSFRVADSNTTCCCLTVLFVVVLTLSWPVRTVVGDYYISQVKKQTSTDQALYYLNKADLYMPNSNQNTRFIRAEIYTNEISRNKSNLSKDEISSLFKMADEQFVLFLNSGLNKSRSAALFRRAQLYSFVDGVLINDRNEQALAFLHEAISNDPTFAQAYILAARLLNQRQEHEKAMHVLNELLKWPFKTGFMRVHFLLALADTHQYLGNDELSASTRNFAHYLLDYHNKKRALK